jgi:O-antigen ligase
MYYAYRSRLSFVRWPLIVLGFPLLGFFFAAFAGLSGPSGVILILGLIAAGIVFVRPLLGVGILLVLLNAFVPEYYGIDLGQGLPAFNVSDVFTLAIFAGTLARVFSRREHFNKDQALVVLLLYITCGFVSLIGSIYSGLVEPAAAKFNWVMLGRLYVMPTFLLFAAIHLLEKKETVYRIMDLLLLCGAADTIYGIWTILHGSNPLYPSTEVIQVYAAGQAEFGASYQWFLSRNVGTFSQPIHFGCFLGFLIPYSFVRAAQAVARKERLFFMLLLYLNLLGLITCLSRGPWVAVAVTLPFLLPHARIRNIMFIVLLIFAVATPAVVLYSGDPSVILQNLKERVSNFATMKARLLLSYMCIRLWITKPFFGIGIGNYSILYPRLWEKLYLQPEHFGLTEAYFVEKTIAPHNIYLYLLSEVGLIGLGAFLWIVGRTFRKTISTLRRLRATDMNEYYRVLAIALGVLTALVNGLAYDFLWLSRISVYFWFLLGFLLIYPRLEGASGAAAEQEVLSPRR